MRKQKWGQRGQEGSQGAPAVSLARGRAGQTDRCVLGQTDVCWDTQTRFDPCEIKPIPGHEHPDDSGHSCHPFVSSNVGMQLTAHPCHHGEGTEEVSVPSGNLFLFPMRGTTR